MKALAGDFNKSKMETRKADTKCGSIIGVTLVTQIKKITRVLTTLMI